MEVFYTPVLANMLVLIPRVVNGEGRKCLAALWPDRDAHECYEAQMKVTRGEETGGNEGNEIET